MGLESGFSTSSAHIDSDMVQLLPRAGPDCPGDPGLVWTRPQLFFAGSVLSFLFSAGAAAGLSWGHVMAPQPRCSSLAATVTSVRGLGPASAQSGPGPQSGSAAADTCFDDVMRTGGKHPFYSVTGTRGHIMPEMFGKVREKTIWSFWHDPEHCPSSSNCRMPAHLKLCIQSVHRNRGTFDHRVLHLDDARRYVNLLELPLHWYFLQPVQQKESLMNALLARYGGVALDISTVLLHPLDAYWDEMVLQEATFRGFMYRTNGRPWERPEATAPWFLMSRREGVFSTAVRNQMVNLCAARHYPELGLGDHTITPVLGGFNYSLPACADDETVQDPMACPGASQPRFLQGVTAEPKTDGRLMLKDPRDGPHLPFAFLDDFGMGTWQVSNTSELPGHPAECGSPSECWEKVVLPRYHLGSLVFVKLFRSGGALRTLGPKELLASRQSFFYRWLELAGLSRRALELALGVYHPTFAPITTARSTTTSASPALAGGAANGTMA